MKAYSLIRSGPEYRSDAFHAGLRAVGFEVVAGFPGGQPRPGDALVIWNRYGHFDQVARIFERVGCAVIVAENGYLGADADGIQTYALSLGGHNGSGRNLPADPARFARLGIPVRPWRTAGRDVVVRAQRGIGLPPQASPANWHNETAKRLASLTARPVRILEHPARRAERVRLKDVFADCHAVVTWTSGIAGRALVAGVPVFLLGPHSIVESACNRELALIDTPVLLERHPALARLAANQWTLAEIRSGEPFDKLVRLHRGKLAA